MKSRDSLVRLKEFQVNEKRRQLQQLQMMMSEFERMAKELVHQISLEESKSGIIDHTGVPDALRGKGVGQALAAFAVEAARAGGWKIMPLCPFFKAQSLKHPEWSDVISN